MGKVGEWSRVTRCKRCLGEVRWQGGRIVMWHGRRGGNVMRWQFGKWGG